MTEQKHPEGTRFKRGDVIQIAPVYALKGRAAEEPVISQKFGGMFAVVDAVEERGVACTVVTLVGNTQKERYLRLDWCYFERIGTAVYLPVDFNEEEINS